MQYALGHDYLLQVGYVGTRSYHRPGQIEFDQALLASPQNPVNGQTTNSINNVTARLPIQGVSQGSLFTESVFIANYNSLQTSITKRMRSWFPTSGKLCVVEKPGRSKWGGWDRYLRTAASDQQPARYTAVIVRSGGRRPRPASCCELHLVGAEVSPLCPRCRGACLPTGSSQASA